ncbi:MAG: NAD(P)H-hydrate dehydratase [Bacteroidales bacterium]|nr:NAD(P)H-hydrate dehydratase [Bacteroidales bacterium]
MKILKSSQIRKVDAFTIENEPILSIDLMERASMTITKWIIENISKEKTIKIFVGPGNNGGDALAIARQLYEFGFVTEVFLLKITDNLSKDCQTNLVRLKTINGFIIKEIREEVDFPEISKNDIIVDGLFGSGLTRNLERLSKKLVKYLNNSDVDIIAIDIPSGLMGEDNKGNDIDAIVKAKYTLTFQMPKLSFFFSENETFVGDWKVLPIGLNQGFIDSLDSEFYMIDSSYIKDRIINRNKFSHKGNFGHVLLIAGSYGKMGAAILAAKACLRSGSGLVTVHVPKIGYEIMQTALPEAMISIDWSDIIFTNVSNIENYTSIGIGPGIGIKQNTKKGLTNLLEKAITPIVIDADGLNILSGQKELIKKVPQNSILTPHPKEFERIVGEMSNDYERLNAQINFSKVHQLIVVLKGAHTSITCPDGTCYFNCTGNPGMATAGSGDVLTGIILSLLGQGYEPKDAAIIGVYLHGLSGDIASVKIGQEAVIASDIIENIGAAYLKIKGENK